MGFATVAAIAALVVSAGSAYMSHKARKKAMSQREKASRTASAENEVRRRGAIRAQVRQERIRRAQILQQSANTGVTGSSGELGGISSLGSQTSFNTSSTRRRSNSMIGENNYLQNANEDMGTAATWTSVGKVASSAYGVFSGMPGYQDWMQENFS